MNYKYKIDDTEFILLPEEHECIQQALQKGEKGMLRLRNGKMMINMSYIKYFTETNKPTQEQEEERQEQLKLPPQERLGQKVLLGDIAKPVIENTNWAGIGNDKDWKNCKKCGVSHFIPSGKEVCLGCIRK